MEIKVTKTAFQCNFFRFIDQLSFCGAGVKLQGQVMAPAPPQLSCCIGLFWLTYWKNKKLSKIIMSTFFNLSLSSIGAYSWHWEQKTEKSWWVYFSYFRWTVKQHIIRFNY